MDIEEDLKKLNKYIELVLDKNYCDCNELNVICGKHCDGSKNVAYAVKKLLAEREEDKKKIEYFKEVDEANRKVIAEQCDYIQNRSISKQKIKDKTDKYIEQRLAELAETGSYILDEGARKQERLNGMQKGANDIKKILLEDK